MATGMQVWSQTAATNASVDSNVNWAEGMAPSQVDDSARAQMASAAKWVSDNNGTLVTSGSTTAYTVATNQVAGALTAGYTVTIQFHATNDSSATLAQDSLAAAPLQIIPGVNVALGEFQKGSIHRFTYSSTGTGQWIENSGVAINAVTYPKIQNESDATLLANVQGANWPPQEIAIGKGLVLSTTSTSTSQSAFTSTTTSTAIPFTISAPAFPPTAAFKNLSIKVTGTSSATAAADFATLATSGSSQFQTVALSGNINLGANGAVNALDTGSLASGTWYAVYGIANAAGTLQGWLASTSFSTPLMPSGYTYKARLGALITSTSTASAQLQGTWQFGRQAQYVVGLAATTAARIMSNTVGAGNISTPTWVSISTTGFVPSTASKIYGSVWMGPGATQSMLAPNNSYGAYNSVTNPPPVATNSSTNGALINCAQYSLLLESSNLYAANNAGAGNYALTCQGWEDGI